MITAIRRLHRLNHSKSRSVVLPQDVVRDWERRFGKVEEVEVRIDDGRVIICPRITVTVGEELETA